jgi:hypothetical protein
MAAAAKTDATLEAFRNVGRLMRFAVPVKPPELPRGRRIRRALEREAAADLRVRTALAAAVRADAAKPTLLRRLRPDHAPMIY